MALLSRIYRVLFLFLLVPSLLFAAGNEPISTPLPNPHSGTIKADGQNYWKNETPRILGRYFPSDWVYSGGLHGLSGSCTSSAFSVEAFVLGPPADHVGAKSDGTGGTAAINYALVGANCANPGSDIARVAVCSLSGNSTGNWQRSTGSNYFVNAVDTTPTVPVGCTGLMDVVITNGAITNVASIAKSGPVPGPVGVVSGIGKNVTECGAKVDGSTDDTVALNNCLATYPHVFVPAGKLRHAGSIRMNIGNKLTGVSPGLWDDTGAQSDGQARVQGSTLWYTGIGDQISIGYATAIAAPITQQTIVEDIMLRTATGADGIHVKSSADLWFNRVIINGQSSVGVVKAGNTHAAIWLDGSGGTDATITVRITDCFMLYNVGHGVLLEGVNNINAINLVGTRIQGNGGNGVYIRNRSRAVTIVGGDIEGNGGSAQYQLFAEDKTEGLSILGTYFEASVGSTQPALVFLRMCAACQIRGATLQGSGSANMAAAILLGASGSGFISQGVDISANKFDGVVAAISLSGAWNITGDTNVFGLDVTKELGGTFGNVQQLNFRVGSKLNDNFPVATPVETTPVIQSATTTPVSYSNSAAETTIFTTTIEAFRLASLSSLAGAIRHEEFGTFTNNSGAPVDFTLRVYYGTAVIGFLRWTAVPSGAIRAYSLRGTLSASAGFGAGRMLCNWEGQLGPVGSAAGTPTAVVTVASDPRVQNCNSSDTTTVAMGSDQTFKVTAQTAAGAAIAVAREWGHVIRFPY